MFSKHQRYFFLVSIFCWMICNWELFDIQNSRENRSKNQYKLVYENGHAVACVQGSVRSWLWALESLSAFGKHSVTFVDSTFLRANLRWPTTLTAKPKTSRQNRKPQGKNENLTAKPKTSRQKNKNLTAKPKILLILFSPWSFWFCREVFCFCRDSCGSPYESDSNSEIWLLRWYQTYCLKLCSLSLDVIGERTTGKFLAVS